MSYGVLSSTTFANRKDLGKPFHGLVDNTVHAFRLVLAAETGLVPRIIRRLSQGEHTRMVESGAVIVFNVQESGMKRWRDGLLWSPSRIEGNFLVYKEMTQLSEIERHSTSSKESSSFIKVDGLRKRTITVKLRHCEYHVISYYTSKDIQSGRLNRVSSRPDIMALELHASFFDLAGYRIPPQVYGGVVIYEAEDEEVALHTISAQASPPTNYMTTTTTTISEGAWFPTDACASSPGVLGAYQQSSLHVWSPEQSPIHHPQPVRWGSNGGTERQGARGEFRPHYSPHYLADGSAASTNLQYPLCMEADSAEYTEAMLAQQYPHMNPPVPHIYNKFLGDGSNHDCTANGVWAFPY
ncbi:hypothetical protein FIBSPDRAFT_940754 [Athelia psychrophila]|uniref:Gti1/Pac2 family-domain-containing protein n=1 Tax=Athelia psychrophila TaxID=1759441 RepID=A0A167VDN7_9AGAM|nr:hypothetical protein FIBSPDRAFT_940754 [Fibularhizoctonia sp. CBS 109695]